MPHAAKYVQWQAVSGRSQNWEFEPAEGLPLPGKLTCDLRHYAGDATGKYVSPVTGKDGKFDTKQKLEATAWKSWIVLVPATANYKVDVQTTAGGQVQLRIDDSLVVAEGASGGPLGGVARLTKGQHAIKVKCVGGQFDVREISVAKE